MRRNVFASSFSIMIGLLLFFGNAEIGTAQVKRAQMRIAGYLCGN